MDLLTHLGDPRPTALMRRFRAAVGAVQVGEHLPPSHGDTELVMRQLRRVVNHHLGHIHQLRATARVGKRPPQLMRLRDTNHTAHHRIAEAVAAGDQIGGTDPIPTLRIRPTTQRPTPAIDVAVPIPAVHTAVVDRTDHRRQRTLGASPQPFELLEQLGELSPVEPFQGLDIKVPGIDQLVDLERRHTHLNPPITTEHRSGEVGTAHPKQRV